MSNPQNSISPEALLAHVDWVQRLGRSLVFDPSRAEDVVQATWLEALRNPPADGSNLRGWLLEVARNAARKLARGDSRRVQRERLVARAEEAASTAETVQRAALQRDVVDGVLGLAEPYRTVVLLRYFEDLSTAQIAQRLQRPRNTVQTQLQRGLARLREKLDRDYGDRVNWGMALLPLAVRPGAKAGVTLGSILLSLTGGWIMVLKGIGGVAAVVAVAGLVVVWSRPNAEPGSSGSSPDRVDRPAVATEPSPDIRREERVSPAAAVAEEPLAETPAPVTKVTGIIRGQLRDQYEHPESGTIELRDLNQRRKPVARTQANPGDGSFVFRDLPPGEYRLVVVEESLREGLLPPFQQDRKSRWEQLGFYAQDRTIPETGAEFDVELRVFRKGSVGGRVVDSGGEGVPGVSVRLQCLEPNRRGDYADMKTDADGRFETNELRPGPYRTQVYVTTAAPRYRGLSNSPPIDFEFVEHHELPEIRLGAGPCDLEGLVVDQDGAPIAGLTVFCTYNERPANPKWRHTWGSNLAQTTTDANGRYLLPGIAACRVTVQALGYEPSQPIEDRPLTRWVQPIDVDLSGREGTVTLVNMDAVRAKGLYTFKGTVKLEPSSMGERYSVNSVHVEVTWTEDSLRTWARPPSDPTVHEWRPSRQVVHVTEIEGEPDTGTFIWKCGIPFWATKATLRLATSIPLRDPDGTIRRNENNQPICLSREINIYPEAGVVEEKTFTLSDGP